MVPAERERATCDVALGLARVRRAPAAARPGLRRPSAVGIAAVAAIVAFSTAAPAMARQGDPPPGERRPSLDRHAARRAALERQRTGEATPMGVDAGAGAWTAARYGIPPWPWSAGAPWGWAGGPSAWAGAPWGWPFGGGRFGAFPWPFRTGRGWWDGWDGIESLARSGFWCYAYPDGRGRARGGRDRRPTYWGCGPAFFPYVAPRHRLETPYDWPWGWPYVPRHRFDGRFREDAVGAPAHRDGGLPSYPVGAPVPVLAWPGAGAAYGAIPGGPADCAFVVIEVAHGGTFRGWVQPSRFGAEEPRELELAIDALFSRGLPLLLMATDGYAVRVPAGLPIERIRVAPCETAR